MAPLSGKTMNTTADAHSSLFRRYAPYGKIRASIRECFSLSVAKAPDKVTYCRQFGLFHFLKCFLRRFPLSWKRFSFLFKTIAKFLKLCYNNSATQFNIP